MKYRVKALHVAVFAYDVEADGSKEAAEIVRAGADSALATYVTNTTPPETNPVFIEVYRDGADDPVYCDRPDKAKRFRGG